MNLQNGFKVVYEKAAEGKRTFYATKTGLCNPEIDTQLGDTLVDADYKGKMIYEHKGNFYVSTGKTPVYDENGIPTDTSLTIFNEVFTNSKLDNTENNQNKENEVEPELEPEEVPEEVPEEEPEEEPEVVDNTETTPETEEN